MRFIQQVNLNNINKVLTHDSLQYSPKFHGIVMDWSALTMGRVLFLYKVPLLCSKLDTAIGWSLVLNVLQYWLDRHPWLAADVDATHAVRTPDICRVQSFCSDCPNLLWHQEDPGWTLSRAQWRLDDMSSQYFIFPMGFTLLHTLKVLPWSLSSGVRGA